MDERQKAAFTLVQDTTKQFIALSTGIIALTITFGRDFLNNVPADSRILAYLAWVAFLASIVFGLWTLLALTGTLEPAESDTETRLSIRQSNIKIPSALQIVTFLIAIGLTVAFGWSAADQGAMQTDREADPPVEADAENAFPRDGWISSMAPIVWACPLGSWRIAHDDGCDPIETGTVVTIHRRTIAPGIPHGPFALIEYTHDDLQKLQYVKDINVTLLED